MVSFILVCSQCILFGQNDSEENRPILDLLEILQNNSEYTLNYNPAQLESYFYNGKLEGDNIEKALQSLLYDTPFEYQKNDNIVLILLPPKKEYTICGRIVGGQEDSPLIGANVYLEGTDQGVAADSDGGFSFKVDAHKNEEIVFSFTGFESKKIRPSEWKNEDCNKTLSLEEGEYISEGPVIKAYYLLPGVYEGDHGSVNINYEGLSQVAANEEYDVLNTVQLLPGINSTDESASNLNIRGATPDQNLVMWEGAPIYDAGHMFGMISSINPFIVESVDVHKGVFHPRYENRIGGILDVSLGDNISPGIKAGIGTTMTEAHAFLDVPLWEDKLGIVVAGRHTLNGLINSPTLVSYSEKIIQNNTLEPNLPIDSTDDDSGNIFDFYDWNVKLKYQINNQLFFKTSFFQSHNDFTATSSLFDGELEFTESITADNQAISSSLNMDWNHRFSSKIYVTTSSLTNGYFNSQSDEDEDDFDYESFTSNTIEDFQLGISNQWLLNSQSSFDFGYILENKRVEYKIEEFSFDGFDIEQSDEVEGEFHNLFGAYQYSNHRWDINIGSRSIFYRERNSFRIAPRAHIQYKIGNGSHLKIGAGRFYQYINQVQDFGEIPLISSNGLWVLYNNQDESVLESSKVTAGYVYNANGWLIDIEGYIGHSSGLLGTNMGTDVGVLFNSDISSVIRGVDFLLKKKWNNYQLWFNYTLSKNEYKEEGFEGLRFPANNDRPHNLSLVNTWESGPWNISATFHYRSGLPFSVPEGILQFVGDNNELVNFLSYDRLNSERLKTYVRWDVNASYRFKVKNEIKGECSLSFLNLLNRKNVFSRTYQIGNIGETNSLEAFSIDKNLLGFTPKLLLRFSF